MYFWIAAMNLILGGMIGFWFGKRYTIAKGYKIAEKLLGATLNEIKKKEVKEEETNGERNDASG